MGKAVSLSRCKLFGCWLCLLALPSAASAHALDEYLQATLVEIEPTGIRLQIDFTPGVAVAEQVLAVMDRNHDGIISESEVADYGKLISRDVIVRLDERNVTLKMTDSNFPTPSELRSGWERIKIEFFLVCQPLPAGSHKLAIANLHLPSLSGYLINAALPKSNTIRILAQKRNPNQSMTEIDFTYQPPQTTPPAKQTGTGSVLAAWAGLSLIAWLWMKRLTPQRAVNP